MLYVNCTPKQMPCKAVKVFLKNNEKNVFVCVCLGQVIYQFLNSVYVFGNTHTHTLKNSRRTRSSVQSNLRI